MGVDINAYRAAIGTFSRNGPIKLSRSYEKICKTKKNTSMKWMKILLFVCLGLFFASTEQIPLKQGDTGYSTCIAEKHNLLSLKYEVGEKLFEGRSLNHCTTFYWKEDNGVYFYKFSNLDNHFAKRTNGNRRQNGIRICHFNKGNSYLCNRICEVENIVNEHRPHVLGLSESNFFKGQDIDEVQIENYNFITAKTLNNPELNVSRVCVYLHNSMVGKVRNDLMDDTFSSIWVEVGLPNKRKILICNAYREGGYMRQADPTVSRDMTEQLNRWVIFIEQWERAINEGKEVIVTGDMNLNHLDWTKDDNTASNQTKKLRPLITELFSRIIPHGVSQLVSTATRVSPHQPDSGLDHFYSNTPGKLSPVQVITSGASDHKILLATRYATSLKRNVKYVTKRCYKNFNKVDFILAVKKINFWQIYNCNDVDLALKLLSDSLTDILDIMAPVRTIQIRENYAPWLSSETKQKMADRDHARRLASQSRLAEDWKYYKRLRNEVNKVLKNEKLNWQRSKFKKCEEENDSKQVWKNVKSWLNWTSSGAPTQLFYEGRLETQPSRLAECMNKFFIEKVINLKASLKQSNCNPLLKLRRLMENRRCVFKLKPVHPDLVDEMIDNLKNSGSSGLDYIDTSTIKLIKSEILPALTHIINLSITSSCFPGQFKKAKVIPLFKSGDRLSPRSYRPVAILPVWSKLLERAVFVQIIEYFESNNLLHPNHHGFRANHNTTTALLQMYDLWVEAMDRGEATGVVLLDMSAAFDMVDHNLLIEKLLLYGFDNASAAWIKSYLTDRRQTVCIDGTCSPLLPLEYGVPQGSIIGPLLYIIFTSDLPECVHDHHLQHGDHQPVQPVPLHNMYCTDCGGICCFADDSSYTFSSKEAGNITDKISEKFRSISEYMASNGLKLNGDKTHLMLLMTDESRRAKPDFQITLDTEQEVIETSKSEKLLGGIISQNLKFKDHILNDDESLLKVLNNRLNALKKVGKVASFKSRKMVATGIIISRISYLIPLWSGADDYLIKSLQVVQNKAARIVTRGGRRTPIKSLLKQCGWLSVAQLGVYHSLVLLFKVLQSGCPKYLYAKLSNEEDLPYRMRSTANLRIRLGQDSKAGTGMAKKSFKYRVTQQWNVLPLEIRQAVNVNTFKWKLKKWVADNIPIS